MLLTAAVFGFMLATQMKKEHTFQLFTDSKRKMIIWLQENDLTTYLKPASFSFKNSGKEREKFRKNFLQFLKKTKLKQKQSRI